MADIADSLISRRRHGLSLADDTLISSEMGLRVGVGVSGNEHGNGVRNGVSSLKMLVFLETRRDSDSLG